MSNLSVKKACKEAAKGMGVRFPDDALDKLDEKIHAMLKAAAERAKANGRVTVKGYDL